MSIVFNRKIVTNGLVLCLDAGNSRSYPGSGVSWNDLSGFSKNGVLVNGPTYSSSNGGSIVFDGSNDYVEGFSPVSVENNFTISVWLKHSTLPSSAQKYVTLGFEDTNNLYLQHDGSSSPGQLNFHIDNDTQRELWVWGRNYSVNPTFVGQLGINSTTNRSTPITTILGGSNWRQVSCGGYHTSAIKTDGTLWVWGLNGDGQLGINDNVTRSAPVTTILGGTNWKSCQVSCYQANTIAIKTDGTLWTWGRGPEGQLGVNDTEWRSTPVTTILGGTDWKSVSCGYYMMAAIKTDGTLWTWGTYSYGQLGINDDTLCRSTPVTTILGGTDWKSVSCGYSSIAAIKTDGTLWVWGRNYEGQLGINSNVDKSTPVTTILGGTNWKQVSYGTYSDITAIKTDGTLWVWGYNAYGTLGINSTTNRSTPITTILGGINWKQVTCGYKLTAAIKTDGTLWNWGINYEGSLGINATTHRSTPVTTILGGTNWKSVSCGREYIGTIKTNGSTISSDLRVNSSLSTGTFYNVVATWNGTTMTIYKNGSSVGTSTPSGTLSSVNFDYTISSLSESFNGNIYNVMVYNRALSSTEITQNYNALKGRFGL